MNEVTIILTSEDAELFKSFRQNQDNFKFMVEKGVFDLKTGNVTIHVSEYKFKKTNFNLDKLEKHGEQ